MSIDWTEWLARQDRKIRSAQGGEVARELQRLNLKQIPRAMAAPVADLARRMNLSTVMLRLLQPLVRPGEPANSPVTDHEFALFALAMARIGAHGEAERVFEKLKSRDKRVLFLKASAYVSQWRYEKAKSIYEKLLRSKDLSEYESLIAKINLASCLIQSDESEAALGLLLDFESSRSSAPLIYSNSLELKAQAHFRLKDYSAGTVCVRQALETLGPADRSYSLFAKKWLVIIESYQRGRVGDEWSQVALLAREARDFETLRDLDLFKACLERDIRLFLKVYFGTPFKSYRAEALRRFGGDPDIPGSLLIGEKNTALRLVLESGELESSRSAFRGVKLRVLRALFRDAYRPLPIGEMFSLAYPGENFDVFSSPHRLFQMVRSLRQDLRASKIPISISLQDQSYVADRYDLSIEVRLSYRDDSHRIGRFHRWLQKRGDRPFRRLELQSELEISRERALEWIRAGLARKWVFQSGDGNNIRYRALPKALKANNSY